MHVKNSGSLNYPFDYKITPRTIFTFDLDVLDKSSIGPGNGIGLDEQPLDVFPPNQGRYVNFLTTDPRVGFYKPSLGAYNYPFYKPNTLYTDTVTLPPPVVPQEVDTAFLWQPGFYGVNISEDGKLLFACNNADNRLEVRDIATDGRLVTKIPINDPMFAALLPEGALGGAKGTRFIYLTSPRDGLLRITWTLADNTFSKPVAIILAWNSPTRGNLLQCGGQSALRLRRLQSRSQQSRQSDRRDRSPDGANCLALRKAGWCGSAHRRYDHRRSLHLSIDHRS